MIFKLETIQKPLPDENRNIIKGFLPDGSVIKVQRYLNHWQVWVKITVNGSVYHDSQLLPDQADSFYKLWETASAYEMLETEKRNAECRSIARYYLGTGK